MILERGVRRRVRPPYRLGTIPGSVDNYVLKYSRSATQKYAAASRTISRDLAQSRPISRNIERYQRESAYIWIAVRADFSTELSNLPGIVPRRYGGRPARVVRARSV